MSNDEWLVMEGGRGLRGVENVEQVANRLMPPGVGQIVCALEFTSVGLTEANPEWR